MPLKKLNFKPGINREVTRYANESGWYDCDKVRFRQGLPEKIGGWRRISRDTYLGICRSLRVWSSNGGAAYLGLGTNLKFYIGFGGAYFDITPIRSTTAAGAVTFSATNGSSIVTVTNIDHGARAENFVTFFDADSLGGNLNSALLNREYQIIEVLDDDTYTVDVKTLANGADTGNGGTLTVGQYQIATGPEIVIPTEGWGAGTWGIGAWGIGESANIQLQLWSQDVFGEDLFLGPHGGALYYWDVTSGVSARAVLVSSLPGASDVPVIQNSVFVSDTLRFAFCFGTNNIGESSLDAMLLRWSDQEDITNWTPSITNQAGSLRLSRGSEIITAVQSRQEVLVFTDVALYSLQYLGAPAVWGAQILASNITLVSPNAKVVSNGVCYWMGRENFYQYDGNIRNLDSDVLRYVFEDINEEQYRQVFAGAVEQFNEVWFFYCSANSTEVNRYVIYDYGAGIWSYGSLKRSAWVGSSVLAFPVAATYSKNIVQHEDGVDDNETDEPKAINAYVQSGDFDLEDGDRTMFIWRCLPDIGFIGSTSQNPEARMTFIPRYSAGGPQIDPRSVGGNSQGPVVRSAVVPVDQFTPQLDIRVRGRQMAFRVESDTLGTQWKLGIPRIDMRPDGRR